jgi:hypothetical protein
VPGRCRRASSLLRCSPEAMATNDRHESGRKIDGGLFLGQNIFGAAQHSRTSPCAPIKAAKVPFGRKTAPPAAVKAGTVLCAVPGMVFQNPSLCEWELSSDLPTHHQYFTNLETAPTTRLC